MAKNQEFEVVHTDKSGKVIAIKSQENQEKLTIAVFKLIDKIIEHRNKMYT